MAASRPGSQPNKPEAETTGNGDHELSIDDSKPQQDESTSTTPAQPRKAALPAWLDHFNAHDMKTFFRCWVAVWVASILMFIQPTLQQIGISTFFASIVLYVVPPASILIVYLLASLSLLIGMCLAWAWGLLAMKAALAIRPAAETQALLGALQQQAVQLAQQTNQTAAWEAQKLVHDGFMLDTRVTVIFYVFSCVFIYAVSRMRCQNPKLILFQLFGVIVMDIFLLIGPTVTKFTPKLAWVIVKPGAIGVGLGAICCLLFFPQSTSYTVLGQTETLIRMAKTSFDATKMCLSRSPLPKEQLVAAKGGMIGLYKAMAPNLAFLPLDLSRGRWNADDVRGLQGPLRRTVLASVSLLDVHISKMSAVQRSEKLLQDNQDEKDRAVADKDTHNVGQHQIQQSVTLMGAFEDSRTGDMRARALDALRDTTAEILQVCSDSIQLAAKCVHTVNSGRWIGTPSQQTFDQLAQDLDSNLAALRAARVACIANTTEAVLSSHADLFDENGQLRDPDGLGVGSLQGIVASMFIEERIFGAAVAVEELLDNIAGLIKTRTSHRIWLPFRLSYAVSWVFNGKAAVPMPGSANDGADDPDTVLEPVNPEDQAREAHRRLAFTRGSTVAPRPRSFFTRAIAGTYTWFTNPAGMYAMRMVVVTIATSIPASLPHSAGFFYREKGIWAVVTAQTCMLVYMADFTFSLISRALGTVVGGVMALAAWYIGSGNGPGNPYGLSAITAACCAIIMWWRVFLSPAYLQAIAMAGSTFALIIGFSYDEKHIFQYGLPGVGYEAFWKRMVTVLLGFVASFIVQILPSPPSATTHVRKTLANTIQTLTDHYALLLSHWGRVNGASPLGAVAGKLSLDVAESLLSLNEAVALLKVELSFGPFDHAVLKETQMKCDSINESLARLLELSTTLPQELQERLVQIVGILDDRSIGDIMAVLGVIEQALRTGSPLPERLPAPLLRRCAETWQRQHHHALLSTALVRDDNYRRYCVAVSSYLKFLSTIDDLVLVLKGSLGESHIVHQWEEV